MIQGIDKILNPLKRRIMGMISRAVISAVLDDKGIQKLKISLLADEEHNNVERIQQYGFSSNPLPGSEAVALFIGGGRDHGVVIAVDDKRYRLKNLASGEVALYTDEGDKIHFKRGGKIEIIASTEVKAQAPTIKAVAATKIEATAPTIEATATTKITAAAPEIEATATTKVKATGPQIELIAATSIIATTPLLSVSGVIACSGIAAGGASPVAGKAVVQGDIESTGNVKDSTGTMASMRSTYNSHTHPENGTGGGTTSAPNQSM